jgi:solute:Na+ symporter, SSS family
MTVIDWTVLALTLAGIVGYGMYRSRGTHTMSGYLLADRAMPWYAVAFSIMATQASAITFISTPGQAFTDGMRFVQYYFGLPVAMVILSITAVPLYSRLKVYTAYEFLEHRFDLKTRTLMSTIFLIQRGLGAGMTIYAPSLILSVVLGWDARITSAVIGGIIILYTTTGGVKAVSWTHLQQLTVIMIGMVAAFIVAFTLLPDDISMTDAFRVAGGLGRLNAVDFSFDWNNRYNFWSGLIGGLFVALAYFGTDQSQVQRYLTGASVSQSRIGLLFNGLVKVPMQIFILLIGVMVFVFYQFTPPPLTFNPVRLEELRRSPDAPQAAELERKYDLEHGVKAGALRDYLEALDHDDASLADRAKSAVLSSDRQEASIRTQATALIRKQHPDADPSDTNFVFLEFLLHNMPAGLLGLLIACVFAASMSSGSGELSALATSTVIDVYRRHIRRDATEKQIVKVSRWSMAGWGFYGIFFSQFASRLGSLIEAVNILGSLFYGTMLGVFLLAFYVKRVGGTATFVAAIIGEAVVFGFFAFSGISWLWYNVIGCVSVVFAAILLQSLSAVSLPSATSHNRKA